MSSSSSMRTEAFKDLLTYHFIWESIPANSKINPDIENVKGKAGSLALAIFNAGKRDTAFAEGTFSSIFSQEKYGAGFTKGLSTIWAYLICLEEIAPNSHTEELNKFSKYVRETAEKIYTRMSLGNKELADVRKSSEQIDNFGGYYETTALDPATANEIIPHGSLTCSLSIHSESGHLIAQLSDDLSQQLLTAYRSEIETHLSEAGKQRLQLPYNIGFVVVAYKDELAQLPKDILNNLLQSNIQATLSFQEPYVVPVRGDNRYSLVASIKMKSPDISEIRAKMGLKELYSEGRPLRFTFGAVLNIPEAIDNATLVQRMRNCNTLQPWLKGIENKIFI